MYSVQKHPCHSITLVRMDSTFTDCNIPLLFLVNGVNAIPEHSSSTNRSFTPKKTYSFLCSRKRSILTHPRVLVSSIKKSKHAMNPIHPTLIYVKHITFHLVISPFKNQIAHSWCWRQSWLKNLVSSSIACPRLQLGKIPGHIGKETTHIISHAYIYIYVYIYI